MIKEIKIQEAEIIDEGVVEEKSEQKKKTDLYIELALFLVLGILIGIAVKTEAVKRITIGFDDYKMKFYAQNYDLNKMQDEQIKKINEEQAQNVPIDENQGSQETQNQETN